MSQPRVYPRSIMGVHVASAVSLCLSIILSCPQAAAEDVNYEQNIQPLLAEKCIACHGAVRQEAGLRLDHGKWIREGGDSGNILERNTGSDADPAQASILLERVSTDDASMRMPPEGEGLPLTAEQISWLSAWISAGAPSPEDEPMPVRPDEHWAFQPPEQVELADFQIDGHGQNATVASNPVDILLLAKLQAAGIRPLQAAEPRTRLRRLYYDLIGLPPTVQQQSAFEADPSPAAWLETVDRLLADPRYGERWARHWMDVWRYSDWDGYKDQVRGSQPHIWRWRDWIIESLNAGKGYDRMLTEMLAGDEIAPQDPDVLRATGFLARNYHHSNRNIWLDATVEHTAKAFLGLTINCAKCHDHKYDPINQEEYYAFRAIFEPHQIRVDRVPGEADTKKAGIPRAYDADLDAATYVFLGGDEKNPQQDHAIAPASPSILNLPFSVQEVTLPDAAAFPALRDFVQREEIHAAEQKLAQARSNALTMQGKESQPAQLELEIAEQQICVAEAELVSLRTRWSADKLLHAKRAPSTPQASLDAAKAAAVAAEQNERIQQAVLAVLQKQNALTTAEAALASVPSADPQATAESTPSETQRKAVEQAGKDLEQALAKLTEARKPLSEDASYRPVGEAFPKRSSGRRLALARWITDARNPLTARVAVNYIWMHHFGEPLVANVFDFGLRSAEPVHRELLDWLAVELMRHDWNLKHIHRLLVTSQAYQRASSSQPAEQMATAKQVDPDNRLLWRMPVRRLDAEVIRDSILFVADSLDSRLGGPEIDFHEGEKNYRRSIYFQHAYEKQMPMLVIFDAAAPNECYRRSQSIVPQQALALSNSQLALDQSRILASRMVSDLQAVADSPLEESRRFIQTAFEILLNRKCSPEEQQLCLRFLEQQAAMLGSATLSPSQDQENQHTAAAEDPNLRARANLVHTLMNHNDFVSLR
ncbi:MAG: PSD1 and planctomycete cytochrome C domain-containing protein [bacterium]|nr:PSD1 and planctomycete cytochrome C domain-containing protein [bacterium]